VPFSYLGSTPKIFSFFGGLGVLLFQVRQVVFFVGVLHILSCMYEIKGIAPQLWEVSVLCLFFVGFSAY